VNVERASTVARNIAAGIMKNILLSLVFSIVIVNIHYNLNKIDLQIS
jgi:hypothetical protein